MMRKPKELTDIIEKEKWWDLFSRLIDVLRINMYLLDDRGHIVLPPEEGKYGYRLISDPAFGADLLKGAWMFVGTAAPFGKYLKKDHESLGAVTFGIPVGLKEGPVLGYVLLGPVILDEALSENQYALLNGQLGLKDNTLFDEVSQIRVVSSVMMRSILELVAELVSDRVQLKFKESELDALEASQPAFSEELKKATKDVFEVVAFDELLVTFLDLALHMTRAEGGSVMVLDEGQQWLTARVFKGIEKDKMTNLKVGLGEGLAGIAAEHNEVFWLSGQEGNDKIKNLLKRPDIKESLVMPFSGAKNRVRGVLNLHTKSGGAQFKDNLVNLQNLSKIVTVSL